MLSHMKRTTLVLEHRIYDDLRRRALRERRTMRDLASDLLRKGLAARPRRDYRLVWKPETGSGTQPGVNLEDRDSLWDLMDGR
jgi:hypothetical protein